MSTAHQTTPPAVKSAAANADAKPPAMKTAVPATVKKRHLLLVVSFLMLVVLPVCVVTWYLNMRAADQYSSHMSFSVRSEEFHNPMDALSSLGQFSTGTTSDAAILYEYIRSQKIVRKINDQINLLEMFSKVENDPIFTIQDDAPIEELVQHWQRMAHVTYDRGSGLIQIEAFSFSPEESRQINNAILSESQTLVDRLSLAARKDAIRYAESDLAESSKRLKEARRALSQFRATSKLIDPTLDVQSQGGITAALQQQLAEALIQREVLLASTSNTDDPRLNRSVQLIAAIRRRIAEERENLTSSIDSNLVEVVSKYEALIVDREFAEKAYLSAFAAFDSARTSAKRRTKYLAVHIEPTLADTALYPQRLMIIGVIATFLFLMWAIFLMITYSFRDRR